MQTIPSSELYTDKGHYAVMTRTTVLSYAKLAKIAAHLRRNAEELVSSTNPPNIDNCRIAGEMLGLALSIAPERIGARFDF
jgi:hypothetical protein